MKKKMEFLAAYLLLSVSVLVAYIADFIMKTMGTGSPFAWVCMVASTLFFVYAAYFVYYTHKDWKDKTEGQE